MKQLLKWLSPLFVAFLVQVSCAQAATHSITLLWDASTTPGVTYNVKRGPTGGPYNNQATGLSVLTYTDSGLTANATFCYVVSATLAGVESPNSNEACGTTLPDPVIPFAPKNVRIGGVK